MRFTRGMKQLIELIKKHKRVYWDWNGTLINDVDVCIDITNKFLMSKGAKPITKDFYLKNFTIPVVKYYESLNLKGVPHEELTEFFISDYRNQRAQLYSGTENLLSDLYELKVEQLILSAAHTEELKEQLKKP